MKIVYFIDHLRPDGTQTVLAQLVTGLAARGHQQTVFCLNDSWDRELLDRLRAASADVRVIGKVALVSGYGLVSMWRWLRRAQFDVAITLLFVSDVVGRVVARLAKVPRIVSSIRTRNVDYSSLQLWLVRSTMNSAEAVIINSAHVRDFAVNNEGAPPDRVYVIPNGVCIGDYNTVADGHSLRSGFGLSTSSKLVGSVGRLTWQKGFDMLLKAVSLLNGQSMDLLIAGVGEEEKSLRSLSEKLGVQKRVHFIGYHRNIPSFLRSLDLYVHPARFEGMPNAVVEAMAAACPIVATDVDGTRELIQDGKHGWLVPPEDPAALASALREALGNLDEARKRGTTAQRRVAEHFSIEKMVSSWEDVLSGKYLQP
jgi:glycosyltransferase involved in cell wall biosynthesis